MVSTCIKAKKSDLLLTHHLHTSQICRSDGSVQREVEHNFFYIRKLQCFCDIPITSTTLYPTSSFCKKRLVNVRNIWQLRDTLIAYACGNFVFVCPGLSPFSQWLHRCARNHKPHQRTRRCHDLFSLWWEGTRSTVLLARVPVSDRRYLKIQIVPY